tara:strand:+ start:311 stop:1747 length:1437 start_codon:yes stop_codon:yes gene_type:complete
MAVPIIRASLAALQFATKVIKPRTLGQKQVKKAVEAQGNYAKGQAKAGTTTAAVIGVGDYIFDDVSKNEIPEIKKQAKEDNIEIKVYDERIDPKDYPTYKKDSASAKSFRERQKEAKKVGAMFFSWEGRIYNTKEKRTEKYSGGLLSDDKDRIGYQEGAKVETSPTIKEMTKLLINNLGLDPDEITLNRITNYTDEETKKAYQIFLKEQKERERIEDEKRRDAAMEKAAAEFKNRTIKNKGGMLSDDEDRMSYKEGGSMQEKNTWEKTSIEKKKRHGMKEGGKGIEALRKEAPEVVARMGYEEGGSMNAQMTDMMPAESMPMPAEEMDMVSDEQMEQDHLDFIINESLDQEEESYLMQALQADDRLSMIFDKVMDTASEFSGDGPVEGLGSGVSDSIPARLSDGEFVITAKATDEIGSDNLQNMMDSAEEVSDNRKQVAMGGSIQDESKVDQFGKPVDEDLADEEIRRSMLSVNPRLR